jgi:predicted adenylyl cyclase CyaB
MPANIEIKAHARAPAEIRSRAEALSGSAAETLQQEDVFFNVDRGRLKLRRLRDDYGQLIYYERVDQVAAKRSDYYLAETSHPEDLLQVLKLAYGIRGVVRKQREIWLVGQTRVHLDDVEQLGHFVELEVVLTPGQSNSQGEAVAGRLMEALGIDKRDLLDGAYIDMLPSQH